MSRYYLGESARRKWIALTAPKGASAGVEYGARAVARPRFPAPFTVRWAGDLPTPGWIIWLTGDALVYDGATVALAGGMTAADGYPAGWYSLGFGGNGSATVWLRVDTTGTTVAASVGAGAASGDGKVNIPVAYVERDATTHEVAVRQNLVGALALGSGGGGGSSVEVGDAEITIGPSSGDDFGSFTVNQSEGDTITIPTATSDKLGLVMVDDSSITIDTAGKISANLPSGISGTNTIKVITGVIWQCPHLKQTYKNVTLKNGIVTAIVDGEPETITTAEQLNIQT